tara:strand:- start:388 stop:1191 length:804 start_codon:yes stop_codon:yes gene_type:complete
MVRKTRRYNKRGGADIPPLQKYGFDNGASSPQQNAMLNQKQAAQSQNELNNMHKGGKRRRTRKRRGGYQYKGGDSGGKIVVPQSENAAPAVGPVDGNSLAVDGAGNLTQNKENATTDDYNGTPTVKTVAGGGKKKKIHPIHFKKFPSAPTTAINEMAAKMPQAPTHNVYNFPAVPTHPIDLSKNKKGGRRKRKTRKARKSRKSRKHRKHRKSRGKYGYNQKGCSNNGKKKSRRRSKTRNKRKFVVGGKRKRTNGKGGYVTQLWGCFS